MSLISPDTPLVNYGQLRGNSSNEHLWEPQYGNPCLDTQLRRFEAITTDLDINEVAYSNSNAIQTEQHLRKIFAEYSGIQRVEPEGSFAFIVPTRIQREGSNKANYTSEVDPLFSMLQHVDNDTKQVIMAGMPPFIVDRYTTGDDGKAGAIIFAPLLKDLFLDTINKTSNKEAGLKEAILLSNFIMNLTTDFAKKRVGVDVASFAAMLPKFIGYGKAIKTEGLETTTGHGATTILIDDNLEQAREMNLTRSQFEGNIGILGTGAIGESIARLLLAKNPKLNITMSDVREDKGNETVEKLSTEFPEANIRFTTNNAEVIEGQETTICAAAAQFDIETDEHLKNVDFTDVYIIDDSQPGAFSPDQISKRGGMVVWPIGLDTSLDGLGTRTSFDYQNTGPAELDGLFGCEAEVLALSMTGEYDKAIKAPVTADQAIAIGALMQRSGIKVAPPQCLGKHLVLSR